LRERCGSLSGAFYALDLDAVGLLTRDNFVDGLKRLGYDSDATAVWRAIDRQGSGRGRVWMSAFMEGLECIEDDKVSVLTETTNSVSTSLDSSSNDARSQSDIDDSHVNVLSFKTGFDMTDGCQQLLNDLHTRLVVAESRLANITEVVRQEVDKSMAELLPRMQESVMASLGHRLDAVEQTVLRRCAAATTNIDDAEGGVPRGVEHKRLGLLAESLRDLDERVNGLLDGQLASQRLGGSLDEGQRILTDSFRELEGKVKGILEGQLEGHRLFGAFVEGQRNKEHDHQRTVCVQNGASSRPCHQDMSVDGTPDWQQRLLVHHSLVMGSAALGTALAQSTEDLQLRKA
jgi:hypothetical protein